MIDFPKGVTLDRTCGACPEQYDMYLNGKYVGYFRLRFGWYTVTTKPDDKQVFCKSYGDSLTGFFDDKDRDAYLYRGVIAVMGALSKGNVRQW